MEIVCNSLTPKDLLAELGTISYYHAVTEDEFWRAVGQALAAKRKAQRITALAIEKGDGPTNKTLQDIEAGRIGQLSKLREYADVVGVDLIDLFRSVLRADEDEHGLELQFVIRQFNEGGVKGRAAFVRVAELVEEQLNRQRPTSPADQSSSLRGTPRARTSSAKRRGTK